MTIAVTAASGMLGSTIVRQLIQDIGQKNVIAIARTPPKAAHLGVEIRKGDYDIQSDFETALQGVDALLIVSGKTNPEDRIQQHRNVIEGAKMAGVKKLVYTSITGDENGTAFNPIVNSNRQTERDIQNSGLQWSIGRNGIYIEPDLEYIPEYQKRGEIWNCAGQGKCPYTSRAELAYAYSKMLREDQHNGQTYNLVGEAITQQELADKINQVYGIGLTYNSLSPEAYYQDRTTELGEFMGKIITGIYEGILNGSADVPSDFAKAAGRRHLSALEMIQTYFQEHNS